MKDSVVVNEEIHYSRTISSMEEAEQSSSNGGTTTSDSSKAATATTLTLAPRLVPRDLPFHQSSNHVRVGQKQPTKMMRLLRHDWFHVFLRVPTYISLTILLGFWTAMILAFAGIYMAIDGHNPELECGLGDAANPIDFAGAFSFSLETCTTVGYGLPGSSNAFFENCDGLQFMIYLQMVWSMLFNAFLFAFFYTRLAKVDARGVQVVMSDKAIVSIVDGQLRLQVRVYDVDGRHPVAEAHVRLYVVEKERPVPRPLRVLQPNDDYGAMLFLSMPSVVSHNIDLYSALHPYRGETPVPTGGLDLRQVDSFVCNREDVICPICGESYGTHDRWVKHVKFQQIVERKDNYPVEGTHLSITDDCLSPPQSPTSDTIEELKHHFSSELSEIICVVEAIDPLTSGTFQALQSYRAEDIV